MLTSMPKHFMKLATLSLVTLILSGFLLMSRKDVFHGSFSKLSDRALRPLLGNSNDDSTRQGSRVRVLCWVMTCPGHIHDRARHVHATWGRRCDVFLLMSTKPSNNSLPVVSLKTEEGYNFLWGETKAALKFIAAHYLDQIDWIFKADDDTYVIVENLRLFLSGYDPDDLLYFGRMFKTPSPNVTYMSGGAGYVLSKASLKKVVAEGLSNPDICDDHPTGFEDLNLGKCSEKLGVRSQDTRGQDKRERFHPLHPQEIIKSRKDWYLQYNFNPVREGLDCCSNLTISYHYCSMKCMYMLEHLIYYLKVPGVKNRR